MRPECCPNVYSDILATLSKFIHSDEFANEARCSERSFTRSRKMPLPQLTAFLINGVKRSLQTELIDFADFVLDDSSKTMTASALCQARSNLNPDAMRALLRKQYQQICEQIAAPTWLGYQLFAVDGTTLRLPEHDVCREHFGGQTDARGQKCPMARSVVLYDVARNCVADAEFGSYHVGEQAMAAKLFGSLGSRDLVLYDRGFPSRSLFAEHERRCIPFCTRVVPKNWKALKELVNQDQNDAVCELGNDQTPLKSLRFVVARLPNGSQYHLVTNLMDPAITPAMLADLYHSRWRIEEAFKQLKARMQIEHWSGILEHTIRQDYYAALIRHNFASLLILCSAPYSMQATGRAGITNGPWIAFMNQALVTRSLKHKLPIMLLKPETLETLSNTLCEQCRTYAMIRKSLHAPATKRKPRPKFTQPMHYKAA